MRTRIKICGMTRAEDAAKAAELGMDYVGLNFVGGPRKIQSAAASAIYFGLRTDHSPTELPPIEIVALCGLNRDAHPESVRWTEMRKVFPQPFDVFQIYGQGYESIQDQPLLHDRWWMVAHVANRQSIVNLAVAVGILRTPPAAMVMDTASATKLGGTGERFDWNWIAKAREAGELMGLPPLILAGGLNPENVAEAVRIARPYAVDVSSGVEVAGKPGIKDPIKMRDFVQAVRGSA